MSEGKYAVSQTQRERLAYIELRAFFVGEVRRPDIESRFGIKPAAASRDLAAYKELAPDNLEYDTLARCYRPTPKFVPHFGLSPERIMSWLRNGFGDGLDTRSKSPAQCVGPVTLCAPSLDILATITLAPALGRSETVVASVEPGEARARRAWLHWQAHALPLLDGAAGLTSAKIDLLPHQIVLTHRVTTAAPRRFLVADEVGLGKTIETALILRELASRGELDRALMVVPAGLVNNWHRELNEVFNLNFEVFGSEGDVTDRKTNAFAKHHRLIASVDTLKRKARIKKLEEAPPWDLVVFDEAHHLTAYRSGGKVKKTENFKLAEVLKDRGLPSGTPSS